LLGIAVAAVCLLHGKDEELPRELQGVGIDEKLGQPVDLDLMFTAENGYQVPLRSFFQKGKPVLLNLVYYSCPMLCNLVLNGQTAALREVAWTPGNEFDVVTISIDPSENFDLANRKKAAYMANYERPTTGWHFLTDYNGNVKKLADQVGFRYRYDEVQKQYAHSATIMFLTPEGKVSRYLYGIKFKPRDVRLALTEASEGKLGITAKLLMFCFHYDPESRSYVPFARNIMRAGGILIVLIMGLVLSRLWRTERLQSSTDHLVTAK
jgi:protein SCO1/2